MVNVVAEKQYLSVRRCFLCWQQWVCSDGDMEKLVWKRKNVCGILLNVMDMNNCRFA